MSRRSLSGMLCLSLILAALAGCDRVQPQAGPSAPPAIPVSKPIEREVTDYVDFTGRTDAVQAVDVRARVTGYLMKLVFKEGSEVKEGDVLCEVDQRPYKAQLDQAMSQVTLNEASLGLARATFERDRAVAAAVPGGVSQQQLDQDRAMVDEAVARVRAYQASTEIYKLNLAFTRVTSPITGQVSRYYMTVGNLVNQDQTLLTTVVSLDPMYAYFDMDEPTLLRIRRAINEGRIQLPQDGVVSVLMGLQGEDGYPHKGTINFVNNQVNPTTGSISVRGVFANRRQPSLGGVGGFLMQHLPVASAAYTGYFLEYPGGVRLLSPGMFVRIRLPIGQPHRSLLVIDRAIASDQGIKYVYVVDSENKVQYRRITTGTLQEDGLRVIADGLKPDDWVVVGALQQVRPKMPVQTEPVAMPSLARRPEEEQPADAVEQPKQADKPKQ